MVKHCTQCGELSTGDARFCPRCGAPMVAGNDPMIGKVVADRYLLVEKIGQGGSGTIYRGEHTTLRKKVAVKILHHQLSLDESAIERFRREATTVGEIDNEHILQVLDFGRAEDKRLFFAMEYLEGETLTKVLETGGKLAVPRVLDIVTQIAEALMEAHGLGYVHRDLRPRNIYLTTKKGRADFVKLLDFGLAKLILPSVEAKQTALGMTFGDSRYMSPEQARGETVDRRADIYSLGVIMYEMLVGFAPYTGGGPFEVLQKHLDAKIPSVRDERAECPPWLDAIVQRALAKKPDDRFVTVLKMLECVRDQKSPIGIDAEERSQHAKLTATAQIKAVDAALASTPAAPAPAPVAEPKVVVAPDPVRASLPTAQLMVASAEPATSRSGEMTTVRSASPPPQAANIPSIVVEGSSKEKTVPARPPQVAEELQAQPAKKSNAPVPLAPAPAAASKQQSHQKDPKDPTNEWFSESGKFQKVGAATPFSSHHDDDDDYEPKKNRSGMIIGGVAGGLTLIGAIVLMSLPKTVKKPLRGEVVDNSAVAAAAPTPVAAPAPTAVIATPTPPPPAPVAAAPAVAAPAPAPVPAPAPAPVVAAKPEPAPAPPPVAIAPPPAPKPPAPVIAEKPKAPPVVEAPAPKPEKLAPPPKVAAVKPEKPAPKVVEKPAPPPKPDKAIKVASADPKKGKVPEGFRDPFANAQPSPAASKDATQAEFFVKLGRQKLNASDLSAAAANFNKAREYDSHSPDAFAGLGEVAFEQGDYNGAKINLMQALRLSPNRPRYLVLLGQTYYKLGRAKDAVAEYRKALRIDPNNAEAQHSLEVAERKLAQGG